jgi:hypothetical protein
MDTKSSEEFLQTIMNNAYEKYTSKMKTFKDFLLSLDSLERDVFVIGKLHQQVCNGGFMQWCDNTYGDTVDFLVHALNNVGTDAANSVELIVNRVVEDFSESDGEYDDDEYDALNEQLSKYDDEYYTLGNQLLCDLADYVSKKNGE